MNNKQRYENLQHGFFEGVGKYDIPKLKGSKITNIPELIGFNYAKIFYGNVPDECRGNIIHIRAFQDKFREVRCDGWQRLIKRDK